MADCPQRHHAIDKTTLVVSAVFVLLAVSNCRAVWALEQLPVAQIADVQTPSVISPNEGFAVVVNVDYSGSYSTDIAILDAATGFVLASKGLMAEMSLPSAGRNAFTFHLIGRDRPGVWMLLASVRVWWHDGWYANAKGATFPFEITISEPTNITLVVMSNVVPTLVTIDGVSHSLSPEGVHLSTTRGFHMIEIESSLAMGDGTRALFDHWNDGIRSISRRIYLTAGLDLSAVYLTEYLLTVESSVGETVGSGWYPASTNATFAAIDSGITEHTLTSRAPYKFTHWSGDSDFSSPVGWLMMNGPKTVVANWSEATSQTTAISGLTIISAIIFLCSAILMTIGIILRKKTRTNRRGDPVRGKAPAMEFLLVLVFLALVVQPPMIHPVQALAPVQPATVAIGDATWYHWNQTASDTLLIWLGGGIVEQTVLLINPCEFESYNTLRFIQDLARYYDVLALRKGSIRYVDSTLNRTIFREPYSSSNNFMKKIGSWAHEQGYMYLYVVGYSVGAMVAAKELIVVSPEDWTSPDGLIIITTKIAEGVSSKASSLRASLLLLYGEKIAPEFTASGQAFFGNVPQEGWRDGSWYHREYHVISDVEHEVWTIMDTGEYDDRAVLLTLKFIETCKSLQFERVRETISRIVLNQTDTTRLHSPLNVEIVSVDAPSKVRTKEAFEITAQVRYDLPSDLTTAVIAFDTDVASIVSVAEKQLSEQGEGHFVTTVLSGENARTAHISLIPLVGMGGNWSVVTDGVRDVTIDVTDSFLAHIIVGYPNVAVQFDGQAFRTGTSGETTLNVSPGEHVISVPPLITLGDAARAVFQHWNTTSGSSDLRLSASRDVCLLAIYRRQYYLNVKSPLGRVSGAGWYDENSTALFQIASPLVALNGTHIFIGWSGDSIDSSPASSVFMNGPKNVEASWRDLKSQEGNDIPLQLQALFTASLTTLIASFVVAIMSFRHRHTARQADVHQSWTQNQPFSTGIHLLQSPSTWIAVIQRDTHSVGRLK